MPSRTREDSALGLPVERPAVLYPLRAAALAPLLLTFWLLTRYLTNLPYDDDYEAIVGFALEWRLHPQAGARLLLMITHQYWEYKFLFAHVFDALQLLVLGRIDFLWLTLIGDAFLLPAFWLLWRACFPAEGSRVRRLALFLPAALLFCTPTWYELFSFATPALQYVPALAFGMLTIDLLACLQPNAAPGTATNEASAWLRTGTATAAAFVSCTASMNGFLLYPIGLVLLLRGTAAWPRRLARATVWTLAFLLAFFPYVFRYRHMTSTFVVITPLADAAYTLGVMGSVLRVMGTARLLGVAIVVLAGVAVWLRFDRVNPRIFWLGAWVGATAALIGGVRGNTDWMGYCLSSRYSMNSVVLLVACYVLLVHVVRRARVPARPAAWMFGAALCCSLLLYVHRLHQIRLWMWGRRDVLVRDMQQYVEGRPTIPNRTVYGTTDENRRVLTLMIDQGMYRVPPLPLPPPPR